MTEPVIPNVKMLVALIWVSIVVAIVITLIDMKLKNDILKAAADFYQRMGTEVPDHEPEQQASGKSDLPLPSRSSVLPLPDMANVARMEEGFAMGESDAQIKSERRNGNVRRRATKNPTAVPSTTERASDGDESS